MDGGIHLKLLNRLKNKIVDRETYLKLLNRLKNKIMDRGTYLKLLSLFKNMIVILVFGIVILGVVFLINCNPWIKLSGDWLALYGSLFGSVITIYSIKMTINFEESLNRKNQKLEYRPILRFSSENAKDKVKVAELKFSEFAKYKAYSEEKVRESIMIGAELFLSDSSRSGQKNTGLEKQIRRVPDHLLKSRTSLKIDNISNSIAILKSITLRVINRKTLAVRNIPTSMFPFENYCIDSRSSLVFDCVLELFLQSTETEDVSKIIEHEGMVFIVDFSDLLNNNYQYKVPVGLVNFKTSSELLEEKLHKGIDDFEAMHDQGYSQSEVKIYNTLVPVEPDEK